MFRTLGPSYVADGSRTHWIYILLAHAEKAGGPTHKLLPPKKPQTEYLRRPLLPKVKHTPVALRNPYKRPMQVE